MVLLAAPMVSKFEWQETSHASRSETSQAAFLPSFSSHVFKLNSKNAKKLPLHRNRTTIENILPSSGIVFPARVNSSDVGLAI
jgi:hypothetical protein